MNNKKYRAILFTVIVFIVLIISTIAASWTKLMDFYITKSFVEKKVEIVDSLYDFPSVGMVFKKEAKPDFYLIFFLGFEDCTACYIGAVERFINEMLTSSKCNIMGIIVTDKALGYQDSMAIERTDILSVVDGEHKLSENISFISNERYNTVLLDKNQRIKVIGNPIKILPFQT